MRSLYLWLKAHPGYDPYRDEYLNDARPYERLWIVGKWTSMQRSSGVSTSRKIVLFTAAIMGAGAEMGDSSDSLGPSNGPGDRLPKRSGKKTNGLLLVNGSEIELTSGRSGASSKMPVDSPGMTSDMAIRDHVEAHAAAEMRLRGATSADLWINNATGPCGGPRGCDSNLAHMLPENSTLTVHYPDGNGGWSQKTYRGLPDSEWSR